jgi:TldD protein
MRDVDFYDARVVEGTTTSIFLDNGKVEDISVDFSRGAGVRALCGGSWGFTSVDGNFDLDKTIDSAAKLAKTMDNKTPKEKINLKSSPEPEVKNTPNVKKDPRNIPIEEKVQLLKDIGESANIEGVSNTTAIYTESIVKFEYTNSEGLDCEHELTRTGFAVSAVASGNGEYQVGRESRFDVSGFELFDENDALALGESAGQTAVDLLSAKKPKGGNMPVILNPELAGVFVHEAVGHASEADLVLEGNSVFENRIGEQIASSLVDVIDDPTLHKYGYYPFDAEGVQSSKTEIIKDGILNSYLHSRETAAKLGGTPGNSRAQGYSEPVVRMSNTYIDNGESKFEEMLEEIGNGIYLIGSRGGQVNPGEGIFQFNAEKGYLVENGEISSLLRDVSLSGNTLEILKNVTMVGDDLEMNSGRCGKKGQLMPVSDGSPHILVSNALVGGA